MGSCLSADGRASPTSPLGGRRPVSTNSRRREDQLHRVPGRMFLNGGSDVASLFTQQGRKGTNQDAMIVWEDFGLLVMQMHEEVPTRDPPLNFGSRTDTVFCGVFDGHGPFGHMVARRVRDSLPLKLSAHWEVNIHSNKGLKENSSTAAGSMNSEEPSSISVDEEWMVTADLEEIEKHREILLTLKDSFLKAFKVMDKELRVHRKIDCFCSGTTAVTLIKQGQDLVIGNIGDSRAILGTRDEDNSLIALQLTEDLKPNLPREAERIRKCRGRVFALRDEPEVARVWLPNNDSPGLAMARAFGDFCLKDFGLISEPEISYRRLTEKDEFIVLATDGIWDVLSNKEVVDIVASAPSRSSAARTLVESAVRAWKFKYPTSKVDDCAVVCLFLDCSPKNSSSVKPKKEQVSPRGLAMGSIKQDPTSPVMLKELSATARDCSEILPEEDEGSEHEGSEQVCHVPKGEEEWSALEGVARVNTLLTLPRYIPGGDQNRSAVQKSAREG